MSKLLRLTMLLLLFSGIVKAEDKPVSAGGSIQAVVNTANPGDRIVIHAGTYSQVVSLTNKTNLTITSFGDGEVIVQGNGTSEVVFMIENSSSITISNLTIKNTRKLVWSTGITVIGSGSNIQILNNKLTDISYRSGAYDATDNPDNHGAHFQGVNAISVVGSNAGTSYSNIVIKDNEVSYCMTGWSEAIALKGNVDGFNVENNKVHHITNIGIDAFGLGTYPAIASNNQARNGSIKGNEVYECICTYTDNGGIYIDGGLNISVMNNKIYNNKYGITIGCENQMVKPDGATENIEIRNNLVYNNSRAGIMVGTGGDDDGQQGITRYCKITGNTFLKNATGDIWAGEFMLQNANHIEFYNNIFYGSYGRIGTVNNGSVSNTFGYNIFYSGAGVTNDFSKQTGTSTWGSQTLAQFKADLNDNSSTSQDPKLVNANVGSIDVHLQTTSPAINTGKPAFATISGEKDIDGQARVFGAAVDIGIDESGSSGTVAVTGVSVSPTSATIAVSATQQLTATIAPSNATNQTRTWTTGNAAIATVNASGLVTGVATGTTTITVTTQDGSFTANCSITVTAGTVAVTGVSVSPTSASIAVAATQQLTATITPSNATNQNKTWSSSNTGIATVNASGLVTAVAAGTATITVTTQSGNFTATSTITVTSGGSLPSPWVTANIGAVGATGSATHSSGTFSVIGSGADIYGDADEFRYVYRSLSGNGEIIARVASMTNTDGWAKAGVMFRENLTANSNHAFCALTPTNGAIFQRHLVSGNVTNQTQVTGVTAPRWLRVTRVGNVFTAYYSSNGTSWTQIATETISMGSSVYVGLAVTSHNDGVLCTGTFDNVSIPTGSIAVTGVSMSPTSATLAVAGTQQLTATIAPGNATNQTKTWTSSNTGIATVNASGLVTAVAAGSATITATTQDGNFTATSAITVTGSCTPTAITPYVQINSGAWTQTSTASLSVGGTLKFGPQPMTENYTWTGPAGFTANTREVTISNIQTTQAGNYIATYTNGSGCQSTSTFVVTVSGSITITVNGSLSDWSSVSAIATASSQTTTNLKVYSNPTTLYFGVAGSGMSATDYQIFINADNNTATGYQDPVYTSSGADFMIENGTFYRSTGTAWGWTSATATIQVSKNASVTELSINRSAFTSPSLSTTITVAYKDIVSWSAVSRLPSTGGFAPYALSSPPPQPGAAQREEEQNGNSVVYPNPTNGKSVEIKFTVLSKSNVKIAMVDVHGREVFADNLGIKEPGEHTHQIETSSYTNGFYIVKLAVGTQVKSFKILHN